MKSIISLLSALLLLMLSSPVIGDPSLETLLNKYGTQLAEETKVFANAITEKSLSNDPKYENYGGALGNRYFQFSTAKIISPALTEYFKALKNAPRNKASERKIFNTFIDELGKYRQKIAIVTRSKESLSFGKRTNTYVEVIANVDRDPSWINWFKYLQNEFGLDTLNFRDNLNLGDVLDGIDKFIQTNRSTDLLTKIDNIFLTINNPNDIYTGSFLIESRAIGQITPANKVFNKNVIQFSFLHAIALYDKLSELFFNSLDPKLSQDQLLRAIGSFLFYWSQAAIFAQGQASIGEWITHAIAKSADYNLLYSEAWRGKENGSMAPNMYASSYLVEQEFLEQFLANASLKKISKNKDPVSAQK